MSLVRYPIAASVEAALSSPLGHAERESEAVRLAGKAVAFVSQDMGPEFDSRDAALEAWREHLTDLPPEDLWRKLRETVAPVSGRMPGPKQLTPTFEAGKRWPAPPPKPKTVWRLNITFWQPIVAQVEAPAEQTGPQARSGQGPRLGCGRGEVHWTGDAQDQEGRISHRLKARDHP